MTAKEFLRELRRVDRLIDRKCTQLEELRTTAESVTIALNPDKVQNSKMNSREDLLVRIVDLEYRINAEINQYTDKKAKAMALIDSLEDDRFVDILYMWYLEKKSWEQIAVALNYSYRRVTQLHGHALQALDKKIAENFLLF